MRLLGYSRSSTADSPRPSLSLYTSPRLLLPFWCSPSRFAMSSTVVSTQHGRVEPHTIAAATRGPVNELRIICNPRTEGDKGTGDAKSSQEEAARGNMHTANHAGGFGSARRVCAFPDPRTR